MRKKLKITFTLFIFGILLALSAINNFNFSSDQDNDDGILDIREKANLRNAGPDVINIITPENKTYYKPMSGYYPATYSFDEQAGTNGADISWIDVDDNNTASIVSEVNGHSNVLKLNATSGVVSVIHNITTERNNGTIEFYVMTESIASVMGISIYDANTLENLTLGFWLDGKMYYVVDGVFNLIQSYDDNTWYHFKIEFNCSDDWHLWIDNISMDGGSGYEYDGDPTKFDYIEIWHYTPENFYFDAFGYSWDDNYEIGENLNEGLLLSFENSTNLDWMGYSLDGQPNKTILGNTTILMPDYGQHTIQVFGNNSFGMMYQSKIRRFCIIPINIITPENKTYSEPMSGYYPATWSFDDQEEGTTGTNINWVDIDEPNACSIVSDIDNHKSVLKIENSPGWYMKHKMKDGGHTDGTIEFYLQLGQTDEICWFSIDNGSIVSGGIRFFFDVDGKLYYINTTHPAVYIQNYSANEWYHFKIEFNTSDDWHLWINNVSIDNGAGYEYYNNPTHIKRIAIKIEVGTSYYDAFGYSWDNNYEVGDNLNEGLLLSFKNSTNLDWIGYSLDGQPNRTILGNTTIPMPADGHHIIQVFGNDSFGMMYQSELIQFTIDIAKPNVGTVGGDDNDSNNINDKNNSDLIFIIITILASAFGILAVISVVLIKKRSKLLTLSKSKVP